MENRKTDHGAQGKKMDYRPVVVAIIDSADTDDKIVP